MDRVRTFVEQLLQKRSLAVTERQQPLLERFLQEESIRQAVDQIIHAQTFIVESWKERAIIDDIRQKHIVMPNAKVNKPYHFLFDTAQLELEEIGEYEWNIPEGLGIAFDAAAGAITGTPAVQGEYVLTLRFRLKMSTADKPFAEKAIRLVVNPDPKSLWQNLPSDQQDPYWQPDTAFAAQAFGDRSLAIASKRGRSHAHEGKFRDDSFSFAYDPASGWGVIAVADGAGSARYSRKGAGIACNAVISGVQELLSGEKLQTLEAAIGTYLQSAARETAAAAQDNFAGSTNRTAAQDNSAGSAERTAAHDLLAAIAQAARGKIAEEAQQQGADIKDYATTLIFALVKKYPAGYVIGAFWVGDGGIGIYNDAAATAVVPGIPDSGEFAGQTRFLTMADIDHASRIRFQVVPDLTALILMTDGITDPKFQTDANLQQASMWQALWKDLNGDNGDGCRVDFSGAPETAARGLMDWLDFWSPGNHDDRTIAILY